HEQGDGVLGGADGVAAGRVHDDDALARGGGDVDVVHADAGAHDGAQPAGVVEQVGGDPRAAADDQAVGGADGLLQGGAGQAVALVQLDAGLAQQVEAGGFQLVGDEYARHIVPFAPAGILIPLHAPDRRHIATAVVRRHRVHDLQRWDTESSVSAPVRADGKG